MPPAEAAMWNALRAIKPLGLHFRRQVPLGRYYADFACHHAKLVIELDGETHGHTQAYDQERDRFMRSEGYEVMRFSNYDARGNIEGVMQVELTWLEDKPRSRHRLNPVRGASPHP